MPRKKRANVTWSPKLRGKIIVNASNVFTSPGSNYIITQLLLPHSQMKQFSLTKPDIFAISICWASASISNVLRKSGCFVKNKKKKKEIGKVPCVAEQLFLPFMIGYRASITIITKPNAAIMTVKLRYRVTSPSYRQYRNTGMWYILYYAVGQHETCGARYRVFSLIRGNSVVRA